METKTRRYLPSLKGKNPYIVPEGELKLPWFGWEAEAHGVDTGSLTVIMFVKDRKELRERKELGQLL